MLCAECQELLSDYLDGDLSDKQRVSVDGHIRDCARCASLRNDLARIIHASASLTPHTPSTKVWEGIRREIGGGSVAAGPRAWWDRLGAQRFDVSVSGRHLVAAAAAVVVLAGAFWAVRFAAPSALQQGSWEAMATTQKTAPVYLSLSESRAEVQRLREDVDEMTKRLEPRRDGWSVELRATYDRSLSDLDTKIAECSKAYEADGTETTRGPLLDAFRAKFNALEEFARVDAGAQSHKK
jgi:anti-sigma factor RsiW